MGATDMGGRRYCTDHRLGVWTSASAEDVALAIEAARGFAELEEYEHAMVDCCGVTVYVADLSSAVTDRADALGLRVVDVHQASADKTAFMALRKRD